MRPGGGSRYRSKRVLNESASRIPTTDVHLPRMYFDRGVVSALRRVGPTVEPPGWIMRQIAVIAWRDVVDAPRDYSPENVSENDRSLFHLAFVIRLRPLSRHSSDHTFPGGSNKAIAA